MPKAKNDAKRFERVVGNPRRLSPALTRQLSQIVESSTRIVVSTAVEVSVKETLLRFGIVTDSQTAIVEVQKDFAFTRRTRLVWESRPAKIMLAILVAGLSVLSGLSVHAASAYFWPPK